VTLINLALKPDRALIATDTLAYLWDASVQYRPDGTPVEVEKLHVFASANFVLMLRGVSTLSRYLDNELRREMRKVESIDDAIREMPDLLRRAAATLQLTGPHRGAYCLDELYVLGFSKHRGGMLLARWSSETGFAGVIPAARVAQLSAGQSQYAIDPYVSMGDVGPAGMPDDLPRMQAFTRRQLERCRAEDPRAPYGGRLIVAELSESGITLTQAGDLGLPAQPEDQSNASTLSGPAMHIAPNAATSPVAASLGADVTNPNNTSENTLVSVGSIDSVGQPIQINATLDCASVAPASTITFTLRIKVGSSVAWSTTWIALGGFSANQVLTVDTQYTPGAGAQAVAVTCQASGTSTTTFKLRAPSAGFPGTTVCAIGLKR